MFAMINNILIMLFAICSAFIIALIDVFYISNHKIDKEFKAFRFGMFAMFALLTAYTYAFDLVIILKLMMFTFFYWLGFNIFIKLFKR
tara:strand:- start:240 stop:503 length:264 start_codon:yes stop_codon:yes gene_type:complete